MTAPIEPAGVGYAGVSGERRPGGTTTLGGGVVRGDGVRGTSVIERRLCVLGEPRLTWETGGERVVTGRPARLLVALVVCEGGASLDQLTELVWPGDPPDTARAALHVHLGALRKLFAAVPDGLAIERTGSRYVLSRTGWDLDVELAAEMSAKAKELLAVGAPDAAASQLQHALDLWNGVPFTVAGEDVSASATYQLELVRLELEELLVEALLAAGEAGRAEALSIRLVELEPFREHRWAQLMRAHALQGRAGEALATYERVRALLDRELGVAPGDELRRLERSVLTRSFDVTPRPSPDDEHGEIPSPLGDLVGRTQLLARVETTLARLVPVLITGAPGAGKTRLAVELARRASIARRAVAWFDLRNVSFDQRISGDGVTRFARRNAGALIVLDNAEQAIEQVTDVVAAVQRTAPSVQVLVTSRVPMPGAVAVVTIDPLEVPQSDDHDHIERSDSVRLLRSLLGLLAPGVVPDSNAAAALCRQLGGLPLAIRMAAELARSVPVGELASVSRVRLGADLRSAVAASLERIPAEDRDAFASICVVAGQLDVELAAALVGGEHAADQVSRLVEVGLVQFAPGADVPYSVPEPLREIGVSMLGDANRRRTLDRFVDECVARARARARPTTTTRSGRRLEDELAQELPWHRQCLDHLVDVGDDRRALELVAALELQLYSLGWWRENFELQDRALSIPGQPSPPRAHVHAVRGRPGLFHQFDEDDNQVALAMASEVGALAEQARARYHLGVIRWWSGRNDEALDQLERGKHAAEQAGDLFLAGENLRFIGMANVTAGNLERGLEIQLGLLRAAERMRGMGVLVPHLLMHLGHSRRHIGDREAALVDLHQARLGFEALGNRASLVHVCAGLAEVYADLERHDEALEAAAASLQASATGPVIVYEPWALCTTARVLAATGDTDLARSAAASAIQALAHTFDGETHRVAIELAWVAAELSEHRAALRLAGLAGATPDRRELPFRSPLEQERLRAATIAGREALGADSDAALDAGARSSLAEAAALIVHRS